MDPIEVFYYVRDGAACLGVLVGLVAAVFLFTRKKTFPGVLALIGFFLLGIEPLLDVIIWRVLSLNQSADFNLLNEVYACGSGLAMFLGVVLVALAIFLGFREPKLPPPPPPADETLISPPPIS